MTPEQKKQRNNEYQKKFRKEKAANYSRLDMFIAKEEKALFTEKAAAAGKTRIDYLLYLLHDNKSQQTTFIQDDHQQEIQKVKAGYTSEMQLLERELSAVKALRTDQALRDDYSALKRDFDKMKLELSDANNMIERLLKTIAENT